MATSATLSYIAAALPAPIPVGQNSALAMRPRAVVDLGTCPFDQDGSWGLLPEADAAHRFGFVDGVGGMSGR